MNFPFIETRIGLNFMAHVIRTLLIANRIDAYYTY